MSLPHLPEPTPRPPETRSRGHRPGARPVSGLALLALLAACGGEGTGPVVVGPGEIATLNLSVESAFLVQATQRPDGTVPLVAGREARLRIFPVANESNSARPRARVRFYENGTVFEELLLAAPGASVPDSVDLASDVDAWSVTIPGEWIREGLSFDILVDADGLIPETDEADNVFPASGTQAVEVVPLSPLRVRFVPVQVGANVGGVPPEHIADYLDLFSRIAPVDSVEVDVRATFVSATDSIRSGSVVLNEINQLRQTEDPDWIYVGVTDDQSWTNPGRTGLAFINGSAAIINGPTAARRRLVFAHQMGHIFGQGHAPLCDAGTTSAFPYADDEIGQVGYDVSAGEVIPADRQDIMSFCPLTDPWVSDFSWEGMLANREAREP